MSAMVALSIPLGVLLGLGLWTLSSLIPPLSRPRLLGRVAPYVLDLSTEARELLARRPPDPSPVLGVVVLPPLRRLRSVLTRFLGGDDAVARRLRQSGAGLSVDAFRSRQLIGLAGGVALGIAVAIIGARTGSFPVLVQLAAVPVGAVSGLVLPEQMLVRAARARLRRMGEELPTVLEFLTLSLSAGENLLEAIRRIARSSTGELAHELSVVVADVNAGMPLGESLSRAARAVDLPDFSRCVDQLVPALERGTPLVEVLRAQAQDSRDDAKRLLIEAAGRKEVAMLVPLVFLILPVTIAFAIFPGILVLQLGF